MSHMFSRFTNRFSLLGTTICYLRKALFLSRLWTKPRPRPVWRRSLRRGMTIAYSQRDTNTSDMRYQSSLSLVKSYAPPEVTHRNENTLFARQLHICTLKRSGLSPPQAAETLRTNRTTFQEYSRRNCFSKIKKVFNIFTGTWYVR